MRGFLAAVVGVTMICGGGTLALGGHAAASEGPWQAVPLPASVGQPAVLYGVTAASPLAAWAVGNEQSGLPLILRWNGVRWNQDPLPAAAGTSGTVSSVAATSPGDAWAMGYDNGNLDNPGYLLHWTGSRWTDVPLDGSISQSLYAVAADPHGGAWVEGYDNTLGYVLEHWNGLAWQVLKMPYADWGEATALTATASGMWVTEGASATEQIVHWDGGTWTTIPAPPDTSDIGGITDVLPVSSSDVWASGVYCTNFQPPYYFCTDPEAQLARWNGTAWDTVLRLPGFTAATSISPGPSGQPQWVGLDSTSGSPGYFAHVTGTTWAAVPGTALAGSGPVVTFTAHIPGTNAAWGTGYNSAQAFTDVSAGG